MGDIPTRKQIGGANPPFSLAILPGVGAFGDAMLRLRQSGLDTAVTDFAASGKPFLGICLGLQLLFEESEESPGVKGLGIFQGKIKMLLLYFLIEQSVCLRNKYLMNIRK